MLKLLIKKDDLIHNDIIMMSLRSHMNVLRRYLSVETQAGVVLTLATILAIVAKNTPICATYDMIMHYNLCDLFGLSWHFPVIEAINDGLMSLFFFVVSLELKRELYCGHLSQMEKRLLPAIAAFGGMVFPAIIYLLINKNYPEFYLGATVPVATDIAFAVSLFQLVASKKHHALKISLLSLAIFDDLGSILLIALLYSQKLNLTMLLFALGPLFGLIACQKRGIKSLTPYALLSVALWLCFMPSGLHPTLSGVIAAFCVPLLKNKKECPLHRFEEKLHHWIAFGVLPLFAFANGGIILSGFSDTVLLHPVTVGCALGLALGKPLGVMLLSYASVKAKICSLPKGVSWGDYFGMALLTGVGFTMSLFLGILAFPDSMLLHTCVRLGVLIGTCLSSSLGLALLQGLKMFKKQPQYEAFSSEEILPSSANS